MYYCYSSYSMSLRILFGKKLCPRCGNKMKRFFIYVSCPEYLRVSKEDRLNRGSLIYRRLRIGFTADLYLRCPNCDLILNERQYKTMRKIQKNKKTIVLDEMDLEVIEEIGTHDYDLKRYKKEHGIK